MGDSDGQPLGGTIDMQRVMEKLTYIDRESIAAAAGATRMLNPSEGSPTLDPEAHAVMLRGVKYALQTSIQAMIDVAYHLAAKAFGIAPLDAYEAFEALSRHNVITMDRLNVYRQMLGMRNRLVHGYSDIDDGRLLSFAASGTDFALFRQEVQRFVRSWRGGVK